MIRPLTDARALPSDLPHYRLIRLAFDKVRKAPIGVAYEAGLIGEEVIELALKAAVFDLIVAQEPEGRDRGNVADAMLTALQIWKG